MYTKTKLTLCWLILLAIVLTACGSRPKFIAPEIDPPADLIPGYVPDGFKLISGFEFDVENFAAENLRGGFIEGGDGEQVVRVKGLLRPFFSLKSPAGENITGVYYESRDQILLITKSHFPNGTLDLWQTQYETSYQTACECECDCCRLMIDLPPVAFRIAKIKEVRTLGDTQVAILERAEGWITVFVRDDYQLTVEGGLPLEENLKIVESLLQ